MVINISVQYNGGFLPDVKKKGSVAFSLSTLRNMMCCVRFQGT